MSTVERGKKYDVALRYRRQGFFNPGAGGPDPANWQPEQAHGELIVGAPAPTSIEAVWSRTASDAEQVALTVTPVPGLEAFPIKLERSDAGADSYEEVDTKWPENGQPVEFIDADISGEVLYDYRTITLTAVPSEPSEPVRVWTGPAGTPTFQSAAPLGAGYRVLFENGLEGAAVELHDSYDDNGGISSYSLRATSDPDATHVDSGVLSNVPSPGLTFLAQLRYVVTAHTVDDYGQFGPAFNVTVPESE